MNSDRGVNYLLTAVGFNLLPTAIEVLMVCGLLVSWKLAHGNEGPFSGRYLDVFDHHALARVVVLP